MRCPNVPFLSLQLPFHIYVVPHIFSPAKHLKLTKHKTPKHLTPATAICTLASFTWFFLQQGNISFRERHRDLLIYWFWCQISRPHTASPKLLCCWVPHFHSGLAAWPPEEGFTQVNATFPNSIFSCQHPYCPWAIPWPLVTLASQWTK